ncbi:MAG: hypothetical protein ACYDEV_09190 [Acidiferrobacter sp.]
MVTDYERRWELLKKLYDLRKEQGLVSIGCNASQDRETKEDIRIATQLAEAGLISFKMVNRHIGGHATITAQGVDVVEGHAKPDIAINISGSSHFQIGDHNSQTIHASVQALVETINTANADPSEKAEAKSLLRQFLEHPLVCAVAGGAVGLLRH